MDNNNNNDLKQGEKKTCFYKYKSGVTILFYRVFK